MISISVYKKIHFRSIIEEVGKHYIAKIVKSFREVGQIVHEYVILFF